MPYRDSTSDTTGLDNVYYYGEDSAPVGDGNVQIYSDIVSQALSSGKKWEDPVFPADSSSLGSINLDARDTSGNLIQCKVEWPRPAEVVARFFPEIKDQPLLFHGDFNQFAINQGSVGNCWFLSVLADVATKPACINAVVPDDNLEHGFEAGAFHFRFWVRGKWVDVVVDDRLPHKNFYGRLYSTAMCQVTKEGGFWAPLLEKAYAKLYGKYDRIDGGLTANAMVDFTGGFSLTYTPSDEEWTKLKDYLKIAERSNALMAFGTRDPHGFGDSQMTPDGIAYGHAYSILGVKDVTDKGTGEVTSLVRCRNPWGNEKEWLGAWCDGDDSNWSRVWQDLRRKVDHPDAAHDGEFWMSIDDMKRNSATVSMCFWGTRGEFRGDETVVSSDGKSTYFSKVEKFSRTNTGTVTDSGDVKSKTGYFVHQVHSETDNDAETYEVKMERRYDCGIVVDMIYTNYKESGRDPTIPTYGFVMLWADGLWKTEADFFKHVDYSVVFRNVVRKEHRTISASINLPKGTVYVLPWLEEATTEMPEYVLRIAARGPIFKN